jgi:hypothetical protein
MGRRHRDDHEIGRDDRFRAAGPSRDGQLEVGTVDVVEVHVDAMLTQGKRDRRPDEPAPDHQY